MTKVLVVDDDAEILGATARILRSSGYDVQEASDRQGCLSAFQEYKPDLVLLDVVLPDGDGIETCRELKASPAGEYAFVILLSSLRTESEVQADGLEQGADGYIARPVSNRELLARVAQLDRLRRTELQLQRERSWLHRTLTSVGDAVIAVDTSASILFMNGVAELLTGWDAAEAEGKGVHEVLHVISGESGEVIPSITQEVLDCKVALRLGADATLVARDGRRIPIADSAAPIMDGDRCTGAVIVFQDITERKRIEEEKARLEATLRQTQKLEAIGTLASGVAHEINNPLMGVMGYAEILQQRIDEPKQKEYIDGILEESHRIAEIVRSLLHFARQDDADFTVISASRIVMDALRLVRTVFRHDLIEIRTIFHEDVPEITCRPGQIQQIIVNLMTNARDALNERYAGADPNKRIDLTVSRLVDEEGDWVRLTVEDTGHGIAPEFRERVFDPFFSTKPRDVGTGLGLSVCHGIAKEHQGRLLLDSEVDRFTRMHLDLPVNAPAMGDLSD